MYLEERIDQLEKQINKMNREIERLNRKALMKSLRQRNSPREQS